MKVLIIAILPGTERLKRSQKFFIFIIFSRQLFQFLSISLSSLSNFTPRRVNSSTKTKPKDKARLLKSSGLGAPTMQTLVLLLFTDRPERLLNLHRVSLQNSKPKVVGEKKTSKSSAKPSAVSGFGSSILRLKGREGGNLRLSEITSNRIKGFIHNLKRSGEGLSPCKTDLLMEKCFVNPSPVSTKP